MKGEKIITDQWFKWTIAPSRAMVIDSEPSPRPTNVCHCCCCCRCCHG